MERAPGKKKKQTTKTNGDDFVRLEENLERFSLRISRFCPGELPDLGAILNELDSLVAVSKTVEPDTFHKICIACKEYAENMGLENIYNTRPIEEGLILLKSILSHLKREEAFIFDYSDVLALLKIKFREEQEKKIPQAQTPVIRTEPEKIADDDMDILIDFVSEALENLENIEVNLIDLEQDPFSKDIINDIFRSFHTIKGVSGFLSLSKINSLAHSTENLLDSARSGDFLINAIAIDAILESVDTLKNLIDRVSRGTHTGMRVPDDDIDVNGLRDKLQALQISLIKQDKEPLGAILVKKKVVDQVSLDQALEIQKARPGKRIGEILVEEKKVQARQVASALMEQGVSKKKVDTQVKVSTQKLDDLVDYAGELVIAQSMLRQKTLQDSSLNQNVAHLGQ
ncbi:MAG: Hpt domain-containing protein, partial [Proteobacteria bacterium]|nr:Hpt domain-containing protein [Pseudomonadota bacterium]